MLNSSSIRFSAAWHDSFLLLSYPAAHANRVPGYLKRDNVYISAAYFSMTQLFSAGAICSSVDDLALWDAAISANKLLKPGSWDQVFRPYKLSTGVTESYAYGWVITKFWNARWPVTPVGSPASELM
jgi:hypothetical protein